MNQVFCSTLLRVIAGDIRKIDQSLGVRKSAWVIHAGFRHHWEFHGPDNFYWHGQATCAIEARCNGWQAWLRQKAREQIESARGTLHLRMRDYMKDTKHGTDT